MKDQPLLEVRNLSKSFGGVKAVDNISFTLKKKETLGLIGPNGSGKSTLINLITGFVKPDSGTVIYKGKNITGISPDKAVMMGLVRSFQMVRPFYNLPAYKNLVITLFSPRVKKSIKGGKYGDRDEVAIQILEEAGFERDSQIPYRKAGELPHGYLKRLELAKCLCLNPDLLIIDEIFSGMSMSEVAATMPILEDLTQTDKTMIIIEHRIRELFRIVDRVICLDFGQIIAEGTPEEIYMSEQVQKAYLGTEAKQEVSK